MKERAAAEAERALADDAAATAARSARAAKQAAQAAAEAAGQFASALDAAERAAAAWRAVPPRASDTAREESAGQAPAKEAA